MGIEYPFIKKHEDAITASCYKNNLIVDFVQLLICRDAYWKIAGDWKPDHSLTKYIITTASEGDTFKGVTTMYNYVLVFPTVEMRDAFYENFKDLIEKCKELL